MHTSAIKRTLDNTTQRNTPPPALTYEFDEGAARCANISTTDAAAKQIHPHQSRRARRQVLHDCMRTGRINRNAPIAIVATFTMPPGSQ